MFFKPFLVIKFSIWDYFKSRKSSSRNIVDWRIVSLSNFSSFISQKSKILLSLYGKFDHVVIKIFVVVVIWLIQSCWKYFDRLCFFFQLWIMSFGWRGRDKRQFSLLHVKFKNLFRVSFLILRGFRGIN